MKKKILKFGGSSVADAQCMRRVSAIICSELDKGSHVFVVLSAMKGITDRLVQLGQRVKDNHPRTDLD